MHKKASPFFAIPHAIIIAVQHRAVGYVSCPCSHSLYNLANFAALPKIAIIATQAL
jgi:hypothetical protein